MDDLTIIENGLVPIYKGEGGQVVDARELHEFLNVGKDFSNWIKDKFEKYGFIEDDDYTPILANRSDGKAGKPRIEYALTINTAKEIAMVENNDKGRVVRRYFIEVENRTRLQQPKPMTTAEIIAASAQQLVEMERKVSSLNTKITNALDVFTTPAKDDWRHEMNEKINQMCINNGLSYSVFRHEIYQELENTARVDITSRQLRLKARMKKEGATTKEREAISKLDIIERDPKLKPIFEGIMRKHQAKYAVA